MAQAPPGNVPNKHPWRLTPAAAPAWSGRSLPGPAPGRDAPLS